MPQLAASIILCLGDGLIGHLLRNWSLAAHAEAEHTSKPPKAVLHQDGVTIN